MITDIVMVYMYLVTANISLSELRTRIDSALSSLKITHPLHVLMIEENLKNLSDYGNSCVKGSGHYW